MVRVQSQNGLFLCPSFLAIKSTVTEENRGKVTSHSSRSSEKPGNEIDLCTQLYTMTARYGELAWLRARYRVSLATSTCVFIFTCNLWFVLQHMPGWPTRPCLQCCCFMCSIVWWRQNPPFCLRVVTPRLSAAWISDIPFRHFAPRSTHRDLK